ARNCLKKNYRTWIVAPAARSACGWGAPPSTWKKIAYARTKISAGVVWFASKSAHRERGRQKMTSEPTSVLFAGVGGQGIILASRVLSVAVLKSGHQV